MQDILAAIGQMERYFASRDLKQEPRLDRPLTGLSARWLTLANDGSLNFRIGAALASIAAAGDVGSVRANLAPVDPKKPWSWAEGSGQTAWIGSSLPERMLTLLKRRLMDAQRLRCDSLPLRGSIRVTPEDVAAFLARDGVDESRIEDLMFGCTLIDIGEIDRGVAAPFASARPNAFEIVVPRNYALLKHLFHPKKEWTIRPESAILSLLSAGRTRDACECRDVCEVARRRLRVSGFRPISSTFPDEPDGIRLAASLLIPIHSIEDLSRLVLNEREEAAVEAAGKVTHV